MADRRRDRGGSREDSAPRNPLGFYTRLLLGILAAAAILHGLLVAVLPMLDASGLVEPLLAGLLAIVYGWLLSGLAVAVLLGAWQRSRFLGIVLGLALAAGWVLGIVRHVPQNSAFLYLAPLAPAGLVLYVGLRVGASQLLPNPGRDQSKDAFALLRAQFGSTARPGFIFDGGPWVGEETRPFPGQALELPTDVRSFVITPSHQVVAVSDRLQLKGIRGPGLVFLRPGERVDQIIDLRPQERDLDLVGRTLDGIEVRVHARVAFQIDAGRRQPELGAPLPFSRAAAFKAVHAQRVEHAGDAHPARQAERRMWDDLPTVRAEHILRDVVSRISFDELYAPPQAEAELPRPAIARELSDQLRPSLRSIGIQLVGVQLGNFEPTDPQVYVKRARNWQAEGRTRVTGAQVEAQADTLQRVEEARAAALAELILDVGRKLEPQAESGGELGRGVPLDQLAAALETLAARPGLSEALPPRARDVLSDACEAMEDRDGSRG